jgi:hypothetical protein
MPGLVPGMTKTNGVPEMKGAEPVARSRPKSSCLMAPHQSCSEPGSTFTPGPMVEETATRWM